MNDVKNKNLFIRVSEKEKLLIERNAEKCGLSVSEYLRQRALGYMPRAVLPEVFFSFSDKSSGHSRVKVDIYFTAVGMIDIPTGKEIQAMIEEIQKNPQDFKFVA